MEFLILVRWHLYIELEPTKEDSYLGLMCKLRVVYQYELVIIAHEGHYPVAEFVLNIIRQVAT